MNYSRILLLEYYNFRRKIQFNHPMVCWKLGSARLSVTLSNKSHYPITALLGILHLIVQISLRMWAGVGGGGERSGNGNSARAETESYTVTTWTRFPATKYIKAIMQGLFWKGFGHVNSNLPAKKVQ